MSIFTEVEEEIMREPEISDENLHFLCFNSALQRITLKKAMLNEAKERIKIFSEANLDPKEYGTLFNRFLLEDNINNANITINEIQRSANDLIKYSEDFRREINAFKEFLEIN